jgi:hypothetical protein
LEHSDEPATEETRVVPESTLRPDPDVPMAAISSRTVYSVLTLLGVLTAAPACTFLDTSPLPDTGVPGCEDPGMAFDADCVPDLGGDTGDGADAGDVPDAPDTRDTSTPSDTGETDTEDTSADADASAPDTDVNVPAPTTDEIFDAVFSTSCASHHTTGTQVPHLAREGLEERLFLPSLQVPTMPYVTPGNPDASYLFHKVSGTQLAVGGTGLRMPANRPALSDEDLALIEAWIVGLERDEPPVTSEASAR